MKKHKRRLFRIVFFSVFILALITLLSTKKLWLASMASVLDVPYDGEHADLVIVEGGNIVPAVFMERAIELIKNGKAEKLLIVLNTADGAVDAFGVDNYPALLDTALIKRNVLKSQYHILLSHIQDPFTRNSAVSISQYLENNPATTDTLILLQDTFHIKRSLLAYRKVFEPNEIHVLACSVPIHVNAQNWWKSLSGIRRVYGEYAKFIYYKFKGYI